MAVLVLGWMGLLILDYQLLFYSWFIFNFFYFFLNRWIVSKCKMLLLFFNFFKRLFLLFLLLLLLLNFLIFSNLTYVSNLFLWSFGFEFPAFTLWNWFSAWTFTFASVYWFLLFWLDIKQSTFSFGCQLVFFLTRRINKWIFKLRNWFQFVIFMEGIR